MATEIEEACAIRAKRITMDKTGSLARGIQIT